jgi:hypothetical protein
MLPTPHPPVHSLPTLCTFSALPCTLLGGSNLWDALFEENVGLLSWWWSPAPLQGFEFEATFLLSAAMFTMAGALPVLPGPCQLLWWDHIKHHEGPIDMCVFCWGALARCGMWPSCGLGLGA